MDVAGVQVKGLCPVVENPEVQSELAFPKDYSQRLVRMGLGHSGTARLYVAAMVGCAASTVIVQMLSPARTIWLLVAWCLLFGAMGRRIDRRWRSFESKLTEGQ